MARSLIPDGIHCYSFQLVQADTMEVIILLKIHLVKYAIQIKEGINLEVLNMIKEIYDN